MILLLGGRGYVGQAFQRFFESQRIDYQLISRSDVDFTDRKLLASRIRRSGAKFLINAAGYTGKPNVDACEIHKADCLLGNSVLPAVIQQVCATVGLPWGHVSSGCIYTGRRSDGEGFRETDLPNFCFRTDNCSFYSGCKALGEEAIAGAEQAYVWRMRIPFNHLDGPRNYLSKLLRYGRLLEAENSITQLDEFVRCCWECWDRRVPFGTYNVTNTGSITTSEVVSMIESELRPQREFAFFENEAEFMRLAAKTPRSNCVLDNTKLTATGIEIQSVHDALLASLQNWVPANVVGHSRTAGGAA